MTVNEHNTGREEKVEDTDLFTFLSRKAINYPRLII